ncbi:ATP-dependent helicase [Actinomadura litoris]|uniref:DNA 3'-5' helicase n=1 Tax=Actinomadura litoris TaxID=2678616 RepID=A0A7K1L2D6_9ACTN|nr:ATP-dependent helicase [Actinomadura litoris]MUN38547.1 AAA family ATPase [Actinomadura litoris]
MSDVRVDGPPLTAQQQEVVEQPSDAKVLVTAGAGAGKTHTLVRRLDFLVAEEGLSAGEVLVLTFSRAAVRELRDRLAAQGESARHVRAQTFDSWALDLLMQVDANGEWQLRSFEERIAGACDAIARGLAEELYGDDLLHVVIDEVQDLVGRRREMVELLLDEFDPGFTVVGDPAQSIYGFTLKDDQDRAGETNRFFVWLRNSFDGDLIELELTENFRAGTDEARTALPYGPRLRRIAETTGPGDRDLYGDLRGELHRNLTFGQIDEFTASALTEYDGTTAVLCRTNGQALLISELLASYGVEHRLQRSARDRAAPAWVGLLFRTIDGGHLTRTRFDELAPSLPLPPGAGPDRLWSLLQRTGTGRGNDRGLDLSGIRRALATGRLPDELTAQPSAPLVVSSFHRAKGLEFDRVVVVDPGPLLEDSKERERSGGRARNRRKVDVDEETRLLYVAMTRPRQDLLWIDRLETRFIRNDLEIGRWARYSYKVWARLGLELCGGDVHAEQPAGMRDFTGDPLDLQDYLAVEVDPGDDVVLERLYPDAIGLSDSPPYLVVHSGRPIGVTSDRFRSDLYRHLKLNRGYEPQNWPRRITGGRIDAIETVAGSEAAGTQVGLGPHGVWLAPRLMGLSRFTYDSRTLREEEFGVASQ